MTISHRALLLSTCLTAISGCSIDLYRSVEDAHVTGALSVTPEEGQAVSILDGELANGALEQNQLLCATPSLLREGVPLLVMLAGPDLDLELAIHVVGESVDADDVNESSPTLIGAISYQGRNLEASEAEPCSFDLTAYDEGGAGTVRMNCAFRDIDTDERFTLDGEVHLHDCFRDRELIFESGNAIEGLFNAASGPDNGLLRDVSTAATIVPVAAVVVGAVFFVGGHGVRL